MRKIKKNNFYLLLVVFIAFFSFQNKIFGQWNVSKKGNNWLITDMQLLTIPDSTVSARINGHEKQIRFKNGIAVFEQKATIFQVSIPNTQDFPQMHFASSDGKAKTIPMWLTLLPPLFAIILALMLKEVLIALFAGIWIGAWVLNGFNLSAIFTAFFTSLDTYILKAITSEEHVAVILFSLLIGGMVAIISRNGGMAGVVAWLSRYAKNAQTSQLVTWFLGIAIFFDDYANTLIVGNTMRPVTDRFKISREKLAYLVDSTAAPVASIAFVTTWIGAELGYIQEAVNNLGFTEGAYSIFFKSLKYAYYPILTLFFMFLLIIFKRDYGPMLKAELLAREGADTKGKGEGIKNDEFEPINSNKINGWLALLPVLTVVFGTFFGLLLTGFDSSIWSDNSIGLIRKLSITIGNANSYQALMWSSLLAVVVAMVLTLSFRVMSLVDTMETLIAGFKTMLPAILVLVMAWSLAGVTKDLFTAEYLTSFFSENISAKSLPIVTFFLSAIIAFSTGSSWGTMAILYPLMLPAAWLVSRYQGLTDLEAMEIVYHTTSVVLAGAVFGDHCSPISDTTILSSLASQCNHIAHVKTQMPYAITVALVSTFLCIQLANIGVPWYLVYLAGFLVLFTIVKWLGKTVPD